LDTLPVFRLEAGPDPVLQIAAYLREVLAQTQPSQDPQQAPMLLLPDVLTLGGFFHSSSREVLQALHELWAEGYDFVLKGLDGPLFLFDPLGRHPAGGRSRYWEQWSAMVSHCWQLSPWGRHEAGDGRYSRPPHLREAQEYHTHINR
jgi:hypothetical protein